MKKIYLLAILVIAALGSQAQSFTASNQYISGDPLYFLEGHVTITNTSGSAKDVLVTRTQNNLFLGHNSYFCWAQCYSGQVTVSPDPVNIPAGGDTSLFRGDLETNMVAGVSYVSYCFYDANNTSDQVCVDFIYDTTVGIQEIPTARNFVSKAYPNPATESTNFFVNVVKTSKNAQLKFYNMLGAEVKSVPVTDFRNSLKVTTNDLKPGIYFYSLWVDGKSTGSGKLMISKN